jgi:hypothetical protein
MAVQSTSRVVARIVGRGAIATAVLLAASSGRAQGQSTRTGGSIGVSLTILQPVTTQAVRLLDFHVDRNGMATVETSAPISGSASRAVMSSIVSSASGSEVEVPMIARESRPALRGDASRSSSAAIADSAPTRFTYLVSVGRPGRAAADARPVQLRIRYLAVAGT